MREIKINIEQRIGDGANIVYFTVDEYSISDSTEVEKIVSKDIMESLDKKITELLGGSRLDTQGIEEFLNGN
jgi:hypothetical protein